MISKKSKIVGLLLVVVAIGLSGCGKADDHEPEKTSPTDSTKDKSAESAESGKNFRVDPKHKQSKPIFHD